MTLNPLSKLRTTGSLERRRKTWMILLSMPICAPPIRNAHHNARSRVVDLHKEIVRLVNLVRQRILVWHVEQALVHRYQHVRSAGNGCCVDMPVIRIGAREVDRRIKVRHDFVKVIDDCLSNLGSYSAVPLPMVAAEVIHRLSNHILSAVDLKHPGFALKLEHEHPIAQRSAVQNVGVDEYSKNHTAEIIAE
jgi:hypothetical protein